MTITERRYARFVRLYPARYPRDEILGTVLQSHSAFSYREAFALLLGALRARSGADVRRTPAEFARSAARLAALTLLVNAAAVDVLSALPLDVPAVLRGPDGIVQFAVAGLAALMLHTTAIVALARGAHRLAAAAALLGFPIGAVARSSLVPPWGFDGFWAAPVAALLIVALLFGPHRECSSPIRWLMAIPPAIIVLPTGAASVLGPSWFVQQQALTVLVVLALAWSVLDARVPLAVAALVVCNALTTVVIVTAGGLTGGGPVVLGIAVTALPAVVLVAAAALGRRRSLI